MIHEQHAVIGDTVDVGGAAPHHAAVIGADIPHADIVTPDDKDVGAISRFRGLRNSSAGQGHHGGKRLKNSGQFHFATFLFVVSAQTTWASDRAIRKED